VHGKWYEGRQKAEFMLSGALLCIRGVQTEKLRVWRPAPAEIYKEKESTDDQKYRI
jgi:hypothetical protein